jgi:hypothetical protein
VDSLGRLTGLSGTVQGRLGTDWARLGEPLGEQGDFGVACLVAASAGFRGVGEYAQPLAADTGAAT